MFSSVKDKEVYRYQMIVSIFQDIWEQRHDIELSDLCKAATRCLKNERRGRWVAYNPLLYLQFIMLFNDFNYLVYCYIYIIYCYFCDADIILESAPSLC